MSFTDDDKQWILTQFDARLGQLETRFNARLEKLEASLRSEFRNWASPVEMRRRSHAAVFKMEFMQDRVTKLEGK